MSESKSENGVGCVFSTGLVLGNEFCPLVKLSGGEEWLRAMGKQRRHHHLVPEGDKQVQLRGYGGGGQQYQWAVSSGAGKELTIHPVSGKAYHTSQAGHQNSCRNGTHGGKHGQRVHACGWRATPLEEELFEQ